MERSYLVTPPAMFMKSGGVDLRTPFCQATLEMLNFLNREEPYCLLSYDSTLEATRSCNAVNQYATKHKLNCKAMRRKEKVLIVKMTGDQTA